MSSSPFLVGISENMLLILLRESAGLDSTARPSVSFMWRNDDHAPGSSLGPQKYTLMVAVSPSVGAFHIAVRPAGANVSLIGSSKIQESSCKQTSSTCLSLRIFSGVNGPQLVSISQSNAHVYPRQARTILKSTACRDRPYLRWLMLLKKVLSFLVGASCLSQAWPTYHRLLLNECDTLVMRAITEGGVPRVRFT